MRSGEIDIQPLGPFLQCSSSLPAEPACFAHNYYYFFTLCSATLACLQQISALSLMNQTEMHLSYADLIS